MRPLFALLLGAAIYAPSINWLMVSPASAAPLRPNVLFLLVDDLGYADVGCFGSTFYETPHIDRLAASGIKFTNAYAACPVCSPTRASILTGRYPARMQTTDWFGAKQPDEWTANTRMLPSPYLERLAAERVTLAETLRDAGYATFFAGKWHLGPEGSWPEDHGFDINRGGWTMGAPRRRGGAGGYFPPYHNPRLEDGPDGEHLTARLADETIAFLQRHAWQQVNQTQPFFAYLAFYTVHNPQQAPAELIEKFQAKRAALDHTDNDVWVDQGAQRARAIQDQPVYAAMVASLDMAVGRVLATLDELGIAENTIVVFTSDNGGLSTHEGSPTSNLPLRSGKGWLYEGGIREPTIVRWPGVTRPGSQSGAVITSTDYYPTLLEAVGLPAKPAEHVDGVSFTSALRGEPHNRGPVYWHFPHYRRDGPSLGGAVRDGRWKLIEWYEDNRLELFDLENDLSETRNLFRERPVIAERLKRLLHDWRQQTGAIMPTPNPAYRAKAKD